MNRRKFVALIGGALAAPLAFGQQPGKLVRIGVLAQVFTLRSETWKPFFLALEKRGWHEGDKYVLEVKEARGNPVRALELAKELVQQRVDVVLALSTAAAVAAKQVTDRIPVVTWCGYPVEAGIASSLARPGGNVTGVANYANADIWGKFVQLLRDLRPGLRELGVLWDYSPPAFPDGLVPIPAIQRAAQEMGIRSRVWMVRREQDLIDAKSAISRSRVEALAITYSGGIHFQPAALDSIRELVIDRRLPAITDIAGPDLARMGCALAYSPNVLAILNRLAHFVDRVLRGANPADLPFELPSRFDLVINANIVKSLGLTIPQSMLLRADRVIE